MPRSKGVDPSKGVITCYICGKYIQEDGVKRRWTDMRRWATHGTPEDDKLKPRKFWEDQAPMFVSPEDRVVRGVEQIGQVEEEPDQPVRQDEVYENAGIHIFFLILDKVFSAS